MSNLGEAYQSLSKAYEEEHELVKRRQGIIEAYEHVLDYIHDNNTLHSNVEVELDRFKVKRKDSLEYIAFSSFFYILTYGALVYIMTTLFSWINVAALIGGGIGTFGVNIGKYVSKVIKSNKNIKLLSKIKELLSYNPKFMNETFMNLNRLLLAEKKSLSSEIDERNQAIEEYKEMLNKVNSELAENILDRSGIPSSVTLNSNMKILSKRLS